MQATAPQFNGVANADDVASFEERFGGRIQAIAGGNGHRAAGAAKPQSETERDRTASRVLALVLGDPPTVKLTVYDEADREIEKEFRLRKPRMRHVTNVLTALVEIVKQQGGLSALRGMNELKAIEAVQAVYLRENSPGRREINRFINFVFQQDPDSEFWEDLPPDSGLRALEALFALVPFSKWQSYFVHLLGRLGM